MELLYPSWLGFKTTQKFSVEPIEKFGSGQLQEDISSEGAKMSPGMYLCTCKLFMGVRI